jgi:hypothetical protein
VWGGRLSEQELADVTAHLRSIQSGAPSGGPDGEASDDAD